MALTRLAAIVLPVALAAAGASAWANAAASNAADNAEAERAKARAAALDRAADAATNRGEAARLAAASLAARVQQGEVELAEARRREASVATALAKLSRRLAADSGPTMRLVAGLTSLTRRPAVLALLEPRSLSDLARMRAVTAAVVPQVEQRTRSIRASLVRNEALRAEAAGASRQRLAAQADLNRRRSQLLAAAEAERLSAQRAAGAADREAERAFAIAEQSRSLGTLTKRIGVPGRKTVSEAGRRGFLPPLPGDYLDTGPDGGPGLTWTAGPGALAIAPGAGRVLFAGPFRGFGAVVIIDHGEGWTSLVTGLAASEVRAGQQLVGGSPLGQGGSRGTKLGWVLRKDMVAVDPTAQLVR